VSPDLTLGIVVALVGTLGTVVLLGLVALLGAALRRIFPAAR
jgi:hypothetical protein